MLDSGNLSSVSAEGVYNSSSNVFIFDPRICDLIEQGIETVIKEHEVLRVKIVDEASLAFPISILVFSIVISFFGASLIRLAAATSAFVLVYSAVFLIGRHNLDLSCETLIITSSACGLIGSCVAICVYKTGIIALGIASFTSVVHLTFETFPILHTGFDQPEFAGKSASYWGALFLSGSVGGFLIRKQERAIMELTTSMLGGALAGYSVHKIIVGEGVELPNWVPILSALFIGSVGLWFQRWNRLRRAETRNIEPEGR